MLDMDFIGEDVRKYLDKNGIKKNIWTGENFTEFFSRSAYAISLIVREKEIVLFSLLQWAAIALAYYVWVQILGWIPEEVWESDSKIKDISINLAFLAWSVLCVALAAYPIGILTGAMGAAHFLREQGYPSTIAACLKLALPNSGKLWMFHTLDGWLTVNIILERLPKKRYFSPVVAAQRAVAEAIYYAWKVGTIGVPPALLTGKGLVEAGKESIALVKSKSWEVVKLRGGYSAVCWIIAIGAYIGSMAFFVYFPSPFDAGHKIFSFYAWMGVPILVTVGVLNLFVRPIYVIASCQLYSDFLKEKGRSVELGNLPGKGMSTFAAFLVLCAMLFVIFLYRAIHVVLPRPVRGPADRPPERSDRATGPGPHAPMRHRQTTRPYQSPGRTPAHQKVAAAVGDAVGRRSVAIQTRLTT